MENNAIETERIESKGEKAETDESVDLSNTRQVYIRGIINGVFFRTGMALLGPGTVLPLYMATLTDWKWLIGLGASINLVGWFLPQIIGANIISGMKFRLPWYRLMGVLRVLSIAIIAVLTMTLGGSHREFLLLFFLIFFMIYSVAGGLAGVAFLDIVGQSIPAVAANGIHGRGSFFGWRIFLGSVVGIPVGFLVINPILDRIAYPNNFALLFFLVTGLVAVGVLVFSTLKEIPSGGSRQTVNFSRHFANSFNLLRTDPTFLRYFITRHLLMLWNIGAPFYILLAQKEYELSPFWIGAFLASRYAGEMCFNLIWATLSDRGYNRAVLRGASVLTLIPPLIVFFLIFFRIPEIVFALTFFASGAAVTGFMLGGNNYLLQHADADKRPLYIGVMNGTLGLTIFSAGIGGLIVDYAGFPILFGLVAIIALASILSASLLWIPGGRVSK